MSRAWGKGTKSDTRWQRFRLGILERDQWKCQIRDKGCTIEAPIQGGHVDHITPLEMGGDKYDPLNCRASCQSCNLGREKASNQYEPPHKVISSW